MHVTKRSGDKAPVRLDAITDRLSALCCKTFSFEDTAHLRFYTQQLSCDVARVAAKICNDIYDGIPTAELDTLAANVACSLSTEHPHYGLLAGRILISDLHKCTPSTALEAFVQQPTVDPKILEILGKNPDIERWLDYSLDYVYDVFAVKTWMQMYLGKTTKGKTIERPQHAFLRVALGLWGADLTRAKETYEYLSTKRFTHASPTLFNAGTTFPQLASCFLMGTFDDSLDGIFQMFHKVGKISKFGGGIGCHVHRIRGKGAPISSTNGKSDGLVPMMRVANEVIRYINQSGRRKGSMAVYLEVSHPDIFAFLDLRRNQGDEHMRARDIFTGLWVPDLFMERVEADAMWTLLDPCECPGLDDVFGDKYRELYAAYEGTAHRAKRVKARDLWFAILRSQTETGTPYLLYKDAVNTKSNQANVGVIRCSNLCTEIVEYTAPDEIAVCTLGSLSLPAFVKHGAFDFDALHAATKVLARNLDKVIDVTYYPVPEAEKSNTRHRPIGIGVQGLQDVFFMLRYNFDSAAAMALNRDIFECMYHAAVEASCDLAKDLGTYDTWQGSPASQGLLQFDLWDGVTPQKYDFISLKRKVMETGMRNSLLIAPMPTASTAQLLGNTEAFEPLTSNIYVRKTLAGDFIVVNRYLQEDMLARGLWTPELKDKIVAADGKLCDIDEVPSDLKGLYKTAWELSMKTLIDMAADRGPYVCQSQSLNLFVDDLNFKRLSSMHFYAWKRGLKTGVYYLRSRPAASPLKITSASECVACSG